VPKGGPEHAHEVLTFCTRKRCAALGHPSTYTPGIADFAAKCAAERNSAAIIVAVLAWLGWHFVGPR
jgi:hypothetical protein